MTNQFQTEAFDVSTVAGNASESIKRRLGDAEAFYRSFLKPGQKRLNVFGRSIEERMKVTEISVIHKAEAPNKLEGRAVLEVEVTEDMVNGGGNIHGGCSAFLIDMASSFALAALTLYTTNKIKGTVSQSLNVVYHSPAAIGDMIRLVNTTMSVGNRTESVRTEIWNTTHNRLVASGVHIKMAPSPPPVKANL